MSFFAFVAQYYAERLHWYAHLDLTRCTEAALLAIAGEASALQKFLTEILEEGYTTTVNRLVGLNIAKLSYAATCTVRVGIFYVLAS